MDFGDFKFVKDLINKYEGTKTQTQFWTWQENKKQKNNKATT